ncbi:unnamed protein product [Lasius platythorax]
MKFILALFAILAIISLGQAHQAPDFGKGPLHEDIQDILDLIPVEEINNICDEYLKDPEIQAAIQYIQTTTIIEDLMVDFEAIPEVINLFNYLQKEGIDIYLIINEINKALGIKELEPPISHAYSTIGKRTGGIAGFFRDISKVLPFDDYIHIYVQKLKTSPSFVRYINQLKSNNFQQIVNKVYKIKSFQIILDGLKSSGVNTRIVADIMFIVLGITVPASYQDYTYLARTIDDDLLDFLGLIPIEKYNEILLTYLSEDKKVQNAFLYLFTAEFHDQLRAVEALKEFQAFTIYLQKAGLNVIDYIQTFHKAIGMEEYVPPKVDSTFKSQVGVQKIGDGITGMLNDLYDIFPLKEIDDLYEEKLQTSKVFADFIAKLKSPDMQKIIDNLYANKTYKEFILKTRAKGLEFQELTKLIARIFGLKFPY